MSAIVHELDYSLPQEVYAAGDGPAYEFPFEALGDFSTLIVARKYKQTRAAYLVDKLANKYRKGETIDPAGSGGILIDTQETGATATGLQSFTRRFALIPPTQTDARHSLMVNLPNLPANISYDIYRDATLLRASGGLLYSSTNLCDYSSQTKYDIYGFQNVTPGSSLATGGTFTFTYKTSTATLNYNDSTSTVASAINALAAIVSDGITVTVFSTFNSNIGMQVRATGGSWLAAPSVDASNLTPATCAVVDTYAGFPTAPDYTFYKRLLLPAPSHGISNTSTSLILRNATILNLITTGNWFVYDANNITVVYWKSTGTVNALGGYLRAYTPGSKPVPCTLITRFSLTALAPDTYQGEGDAFLQAIFAGSTAINYRVGDATPWPDDKSPINSLTTTTISAANL